jgi:hypothetical protein
MVHTYKQSLLRAYTVGVEVWHLYRWRPRTIRILYARSCIDSYPRQCLLGIIVEELHARRERVLRLRPHRNHGRVHESTTPTARMLGGSASVLESCHFKGGQLRGKRANLPHVNAQAFRPNTEDFYRHKCHHAFRQALFHQRVVIEQPDRSMYDTYVGRMY